jgi:hypothetical protein
MLPKLGFRQMTLKLALCSQRAREGAAYPDRASGITAIVPQPGTTPAPGHISDISKDYPPCRKELLPSNTGLASEKP